MVERVCVIGAGVIGSLFAGHLAQVAEVSVLTRRREHAAALEAEGLRVTGRSDLHARVLASSDPNALPPFDLGIVATKANGLDDAARSLEGRFPEATMMTVLNGLGAEAAVRARGSWPIVSAVTFMSGTKHSDTEVEYILDTETWLGPYEDMAFEKVEEIAALIVDSGLKAEALPISCRRNGPSSSSMRRSTRSRHSPASRTTGTSPPRSCRPISATSFTTSSTRARRWLQRQVSSCTTTPGR